MAGKAYLTRVMALIERLQQLQVVVPEDTGYVALEDGLLRDLTSLLEATSTLLDDVRRGFEDGAPARDGGGEAEDSASLADIGAQISSELAAREIADLAFVGRNQILAARDGFLRARQQSSMWEVISYADAGLRRMGKALIAIESALREYEGLPPVERRWDDLEDAVEIRRTYGQFRRAILRGGEPADDELETRLRRAARRIAILRDLRIYPYLRIDDRRQIRSFQKRIAAWLKSDPEDPERLAQGRRLWQDLTAFSRLLAQVNNRQSLREHDRVVVGRSIRALFVRRPLPRRMPAEVLAGLQTLLGRDDELDDLLRQPEPPPVEAWRAPLLRLQHELDQGYGGEGSALIL
ncbi:MAG: hypothetical protein D6696_12780 [Acidobacteria bacterium]|nr:MAG: hypothetical protein D6696_12780 [Acidobacteriota bacterium]